MPAEPSSVDAVPTHADSRSAMAASLNAAVGVGADDASCSLRRRVADGGRLGATAGAFRNSSRGVTDHVVVWLDHALGTFAR